MALDQNDAMKGESCYHCIKHAQQTLFKRRIANWRYNLTSAETSNKTDF